jgi:hypothetical protein
VPVVQLQEAVIVPVANIERMVIRYKSTLKLAHETGSTGSGRVAAKLHAEAVMINDICQSLLGTTVWHDVLDRQRLLSDAN